MARKIKRSTQKEGAPSTSPATISSSQTNSSSSASTSDVAPSPALPSNAPLDDELHGPEPTIKQENPEELVLSYSTSEKMNGTIHVKVLRASNLATMTFGKRQDPVVLVELDNSSPKSWATTDPAFYGNTNPEWKEGSNNELELFYDARSQGDKSTLTFEVYSNESGDELLGSGQLDVTNLVQKYTTEPKQVSIPLDGNRGEVVADVWFGPPVRKAFRAAARTTKLLDARDAFVSTVCGVVSGICAVVSRYVLMPIMDFAKKHRKLSIALAALLSIMAGTMIMIFLAVAVPAGLVAFFTFPLWIVPLLATSFFTAPFWVPILLVLGLLVLFIATLVFGLGVTSRPVRRKGAMISNKIKHSNAGKRVIYEKAT
ncbi:hypothetical protein PsorP6_018117 [Peronosclerospora sorghi]|uniref:Uncharacterized protein n=1 Tax=Peronosclerospora sorghi TaxID=230839 RepID=A0ACC0WFM9_9STRA|nr:hypothetical protein PsorP6_018117 [Peronosclerospora sorghi]